MPVNDPEGYNSPPTEADVDRVVDAQAATLEEMASTAAPTGDFTDSRVKMLAGAIDSVAKLMNPDAEPVDASIQETDMGGTLSPSLTQAYQEIQAAAAEFAATVGEETEIPPIDQLTDDQSLSIAAGAIKALMTDREFRRWLEEPRPEEEEVMPEEPMAPPAAPDSVEQQFLSGL
jgi:hypothetical protein